MKKLIPTLLLSLCFVSGFTQNAPCTDIGFESLPTGTNSSAAWNSWTGSASNSILCPTLALSYTPYNATSIVTTTPVEDVTCGHVGKSPFSGNHIMQLNKGSLCTRTKLAQNFFVTNANCIYRYAYKGVLDMGHANCDAGSLIFNFYDCNNNLIGASSKTVCVGFNNSGNVDAGFWATGAPAYQGGPIVNGIAYTPEWVLHSANLRAYIGSCVTVEVIVSPCTCCGWNGYMYYDAECSGSVVETPGNTLRGVNAFTACAGTASLSGTGGFSSYLWQGPANSGVSGSTNSAIATSVSGSYSLTVISGTQVTTDAFNLTVAGAPGLVLVASSPTSCVGGTVMLQATGNNIVNYLWNVIPSGTSSLAVSPTVNTFYSVFSENTSGCMAYSSLLLPVLPSPQLVQISASSPGVCPGGVLALTALGNANLSYTWSTGSNAPGFSQTLFAPAVFSVSATNTLGCVSSDTISISIFTPVQVQISASNMAVCSGQTLVLSIQDPAISSYVWSNGQMNQPALVVLNNSTTWSVAATDLNGCASTSTIALSAMPLPDLQVSPVVQQVCVGQTVTAVASSTAIVSYLWNTGAAVNSMTDIPSANMVYVVTAFGQNGCSASASLAVTVMPLPIVQIATPEVICQGESFQLSTIGTSGIISYLWSTGGTGNSEQVAPLVTTAYSVTATDNNGCSAMAAQLLQVDACTGIKEDQVSESFRVHVFPNPSSDQFTLLGQTNTVGQILNALGQVVKEFDLNAGNNFSQSFSGFATGVYFVRTGSASVKVIVN